MNYFRVLSAVLLVLVLALTLGWKLAVRPGGSDANDNESFQRQIAAFLERQRFKVSMPDRIEEGHPTIRAASASCRLLIARSPPMGWDRDLIRQNASPTDQVFVVFRGRTYAEQPTWLTVPDFLWARLRRELGFSSQASTVLAVIATRNCSAEKLPWAEII